jgi:hypothetical protein
MNDTVNNEELANDSNEWTNDNIGWRQTEDEGERMKTVRSTGGNHGRWILGMLEAVARG